MLNNNKDNKKNIMMTFDYELYLGENSGTIEKSILSPVEVIIDLFKKHNGKGIFFVDSTFLLHLKKENTQKFKLISEQLKKLITNGHSVELHLHPQWIDANYNRETERWSFDSMDHYRLHSLKKTDLESIFTDSLSVLQNILQEVNPNYQVSSFRAGGWCVQPFNALKTSFQKNNICNDFSVVPGFSEKSSIRYFDYSRVKNTKTNWKFSDDVCIEDANGEFLEVPCSVFKLSYYRFIKNKMAIKNMKRFGDGKGAVQPSSKMQKVKKLKNRKISLNIDFMSRNVLKHCIEQSSQKSLVVVGHPKILSTEGIDCLEYLLSNHRTIGISEVNAGVLNE